MPAFPPCPQLQRWGPHRSAAFCQPPGIGHPTREEKEKALASSFTWPLNVLALSLLPVYFHLFSPFLSSPDDLPGLIPSTSLTLRWNPVSLQHSLPSCAKAPLLKNSRNIQTRAELPGEDAVPCLSHYCCLSVNQLLRNTPKGNWCPSWTPLPGTFQEPTPLLKKQHQYFASVLPWSDDASQIVK